MMFSQVFFKMVFPWVDEFLGKLDTSTLVSLTLKLQLFIWKNHVKKWLDVKRPQQHSESEQDSVVYVMHA